MRSYAARGCWWRLLKRSLSGHPNNIASRGICAIQSAAWASLQQVRRLESLCYHTRLPRHTDSWKHAFRWSDLVRGGEEDEDGEVLGDRVEAVLDARRD